jgi:hypothetical protein
VHFEPANSPAKSGRMGLLASLKSTYSKVDQSSSPIKSGSGPGSGGGGILTKLHERLAATRSSPLSNLDVPKLKDLKSHSFPPPFNNRNNRDSASNNHHIINNQETTTAQTIINNTSTDSSSSNSSSTSDSGSSFAKANASFTNFTRETTDDRRKRWLHTNHTISTG